MCGISNYFHPFIESPKVIFNNHSGLYYFFDVYLLISVEFNSNTYELCLKTVFKQNKYSSRVFESDQIFISGSGSKVENAIELIDKLSKESIENSNLKNKVLLLNGNNYGEVDILPLIKIIDLEKTNLNNLFLPHSKKEQIFRFIHSVKNFSSNKISLRYLFNGKPGTGKTQIMNSIVNEIKDSATVIIYNNSEIPLNQLFDLCKQFEPCVLVIDDLDFLAENRTFNNNKMILKDFLQALDGFIQNKIFLLTATNNKHLVDEAASRPGRFDMILDIGKIEPANYLSLIKRETNDEQIISFFDDDTLTKIENDNVSGAFIVSLIKQLCSAKLLKGELTRSDFNEYLKLSHSGFYTYNDQSFVKAIGFGE